MIKIVICEDEKVSQDICKNYLEDIFKELTIEYEVSVFSSAEELMTNYPGEVDIFLLDIQMDNINGMELARDIRRKYKNDVEIIFITSAIEYVQEGYEVRAYRYLLKPLEYTSLEKHIASCIKEISEKNKYLIINERNNISKIKISDITYIEIQKKDMTIHTLDRNYSIKDTMENIEKQVSGSNFYRCHKSFLINLEYVESIKQYVAILDNKEEVLISRHRFKGTKESFFNFMERKLC